MCREGSTGEGEHERVMVREEKSLLCCLSETGLEGRRETEEWKGVGRAEKVGQGRAVGCV